MANDEADYDIKSARAARAYMALQRLDRRNPLLALTTTAPMSEGWISDFRKTGFEPYDINNSRFEKRFVRPDGCRGEEWRYKLSSSAKYMAMYADALEQEAFRVLVGVFPDEPVGFDRVEARRITADEVMVVKPLPPWPQPEGYKQALGKDKGE